MESTHIHPPACAKCDEPMTFHSVQTVGPQEVNVFECKDCRKLSAISIKPPGAFAKRA